MSKGIESGIITAILQYLQLLANQGLLFYQRNQSGMIRGRKGNNTDFLMRLAPAGSPDIMVFTSTETESRAIFFEVKAPGGKMRPSQVEYQAKAIKHGFDYYVVYGVDDVEKILTNIWGK